MIRTILFVCLGYAAARSVDYIDPKHLDSLRASGQHEEFARLAGVDVSLIRAEKSEDEPKGSRYNHVSHLGDILLTEEQERNALNFRRKRFSKWPGGVIPYVISSEYSPRNKNRIQRAIDDLNSKVRRVQLVPHTTENDYIHIVSGDGCWSYLGRKGGQQTLSLQANGCVTSGTVQHEIMHAIGFTHEHNRSDRDGYVTVLWDKIPEDWHSQYYKVNSRDYKNIRDYDYDSVMHYSMGVPGKWNLDAFRLPPGIDRNRLGQDVGVSELDIAKINDLYS